MGAGERGWCVGGASPQGRFTGGGRDGRLFVHLRETGRDGLDGRHGEMNTPVLKCEKNPGTGETTVEKENVRRPEPGGGGGKRRVESSGCGRPFRRRGRVICLGRGAFFPTQTDEETT